MKVVRRHIAQEEVTDRARVSALTMYSTPPAEKLSLTEFEDFAFDRLRRTPHTPSHRDHRHSVPRILLTFFPRAFFLRARAAVLGAIDMARAKGQKGEALAKTINDAVQRHMPKTQPGLRKDYYSHFILRLAYCRT